MTDTSGQKCLELSKLSGPLGSLEKMLLATSLWASTRCYLTWKAKDTKQGALLFRLSPQTPRTDETDVGLWATPRTSDGTGGPRQLDERGRRISKSNPNLKFGANLADQVRVWPTPTARDWKGASGRALKGEAKDLPSEAGGSLNPQWVEWLMGYPVGYTDLSN